MDPLAPAQTYRVTVSGLSYGPHGIARIDGNGKVLFVRSAVPGEVVEVAVREDHGSYAFADVTRIVSPSAERREPPCRYLPRCGGCPWQHVAYAAQLRAKEANVRDAVQRIGGIQGVPIAPILPSPDEYAYRGRLSMRVEAGRLGFYVGGTHELLDVAHCLLAQPAVDAAITAAGPLLPRLASRVRRLEIASCGDGPAVVILGEVQGAFRAEDEATIRDWLERQPAVRGAVFSGRRWRRRWGDDRMTWQAEAGYTLTARAGAFTQVNPRANRLLVQSVLELGQFASADCVLDLFAGFGNLTVPIARRARYVTGVEQEAGAAADARANVSRLGLSNCRIVTDDARAAVASLARQRRRFETVVLDPPRHGAAALIDDLLTLGPARVIYVSCNPTTLARDLKRLATRYAVDAVQPIDLFPHSYHVETVVRAVLTC
jgi:23S rRNA (uracil1939-C5)-methyltransferase